MKKFLLLIFVFSMFFAFFPTSINAEQIERIAPNKEFYKGIDDFIKGEMRKSNADPEKGKYNFVVALSTSHFTSDQRNVVAMKQAACLIANNICTPFDSISSVAWELDVWDTSDTFKLSEDGAERKQFVNSLPKTTMNESKGGHDTYKALMSILKKTENPESTIVVLITNSHESRGPIGEHRPVIGKNSPELKSLLQEKGFRFPEDNSFPFYFEDNDKPTEIFITLALPKNLKSMGNNEENRYPSFPYSTWVPDDYKPSAEVLPEPVKPEPAEEESGVTQPTETPTPSETQTTTEENKGGLPIVPIAIGAVVVICGIIFAVMPKSKNGNDKKAKKGKTHKIEFSIDDNPYKEEIEENITYELIFVDGNFEKPLRIKGEENPNEPVPEDAKSVFEISYSVDDDSFIFQFNESSMSTDPSEFNPDDIQEMVNKRYRVRNGAVVSLSIDLDGQEYSLIIG